MTLKEYYTLYDKDITLAIISALKEDHVNNDVTTKLTLAGTAGKKKLKAVLLCKEDCIVAGIEIFKRVYKTLDPKAKFTFYAADGAWCKKGKKVLEVTSSREVLLKGERTALNFLQRMSGIATLTGAFVKMLKYKDARILHTRKTTPNFRIFEAAAVKTGGGDFHRLHLGSAVMIKDNHIEAVGGMQELMDLLVKKKIQYSLKQKFEIEVKSFEEIELVTKYAIGTAEVIMIDNFAPRHVDKAIGILKKAGFMIEVSGGVNLRNFGKYQRKGIDFYSIGMLTHSYKSCDFSLEF
jgi:nicotinate-nucleotide pyrophosphorylase